MMRTAPVFAAFLKVHILKMNKKSYMMHVFVMPKEEVAAWVPPKDVDPDTWMDNANYGGCAAIFCGKGDECRNCNTRPPFNVLVEVQETLGRLGLSRHAAGVRVMCVDEVGDVFALEDTPVPQPVLVGPLFDNSQTSLSSAGEAAAEDADVGQLQKALGQFGIECGPRDSR